MNLAARCLEHGWKRIAFVGVTKHAGKTTALNTFVSEAEMLERRVGLCSIGLDGERLDTILGVAKPSVYAPYGAIVVSAEKALDAADAGLEWLDVLPVDSPLGRLVVCRVTRPGNVVLAGVRQRAHVQQIVPKMFEHGADFALVDGAFSRIAAAAPDLVDAAVVAVGAVAGKSVPDVLQAAQPFLQRFQLPVADDVWLQRLCPAMEAGAVGWWQDGQVHVAGSGSLFGLTQHSRWTSQVEAVWLPGALTDSVLAELASHPQPLTLIVNHPAQVLLNGESYPKWYQRGHRLCVRRPIPLAAVACNPVSITGYTLPASELRAALQDMVDPVPVYDALQVREAML